MQGGHSPRGSQSGQVSRGIRGVDCKRRRTGRRRSNRRVPDEPALCRAICRGRRRLHVREPRAFSPESCGRPSASCSDPAIRQQRLRARDASKSPNRIEVPDELTFAGRVLGPDGKPVDGAQVYLVLPDAQVTLHKVAASAADGRFRSTVRNRELSPDLEPPIAGDSPRSPRRRPVTVRTRRPCRCPLFPTLRTGRT